MKWSRCLGTISSSDSNNRETSHRPNSETTCLCLRDFFPEAEPLHASSFQVVCAAHFVRDDEADPCLFLFTLGKVD